MNTTMSLPELDWAWKRVRRLLGIAYLWCPVVVIVLALVVVAPTWPSDFVWWSVVPAAVATVVAVLAQRFLASQISSPGRWVSGAVLALMLECAAAAMGGMAVVGSSSFDGPAWVASAAFFAPWPAIVVGGATAFSAVRTILPPKTPLWGETDFAVGFQVRYLGKPAVNGFGPNSGPKVQTLGLSVSATSASLWVGSPGYLGARTAPDEGVYLTLELSDVQECHPVMLGQDVLAQPWLALRSGTPIWAAPGEAVRFRTLTGEILIPVVNAGLAADLIQRRIRRASHRGTPEHTL
ncbi:hypothetical protein [Rhodococcus sp. NPDC058521]|uniref:hypothetical protein n=1 Tax=Rhodococcus sp. NPDC058521 TaxID=3346536 RepID=UPI00365B6CB0